MKIRQPWLIRTLAFFLALVMRLWMGTLNFRYRPLGPNVDPRDPRTTDRYIYAFWHESLLMPTYVFGHRVCALISQHADGELVTQICKHLRIKVARGSSTRGAVQGVRAMLKMSGRYHLALSPDGPRGPRRRVQAGIIYLASKTGLPIVAGGFACERPWRARSWDRFILPRPWSRGVGVTTPPLHVPPDVDKAELERYRRLLEENLHWAMATAEGMMGERQPGKAGGEAAGIQPAA